MKRIIIISSTMFLLLVSGLLIAPSFINWSSYKEQAQTQIKKLSGYDIEIAGDLGLILLPAPKFFIEDLSIRAPKPSQNAELFKLARLDLNVAFWPLLSGNIKVQTINLVEPSLILSLTKDGKGNWETPQLKELLAGKDNTPKGSNKWAQAISLENFKIENGSLSFHKAGDETPLSLNKINFDLSASSLHGPFKVQGDLNNNDKTITLSLQTGRIDPTDKVLSLKFEARSKDPNMHLKYAGIVDYSEKIMLQGEAIMTLSDLPKIPAGKILTAKGLLKASPQKMTSKDITLKLGEDQFSGALALSFSPLILEANFTSETPFTLDQWIPEEEVKKGQPNLFGSYDFLPGSLNTPMSFDTDITISIPQIIYADMLYKGVTLSLNKKNNAVSLSGKIEHAPGRGSLELRGDLNFLASSISKKTGAQIYSDPVLDLSLKGASQNIAQTLAPIPALSDIEIPTFWKSANLDLKAIITPSSFKVKSADLTLGESKIQASGTLTQGLRPHIKLDLNIDKFNGDTLLKSQNTNAPKAEKKSIEQNMSSIHFPYDLTLDLGIHELELQGKKLSGLRVQAQLKKNALTLDNFSAKNYAGLSFKASGALADIKNISGLELDLTARARDLSQFLKEETEIPLTFPKALKAANMSLTALGDANKLSFKTQIKAMNTDIVAQGVLEKPFTSPAPEKMNLQIKHKNMAAFIRNLAPDTPNYQSWNKPLDLYTQIKKEGDSYIFQDLKANLAGTSLEGALALNIAGERPEIRGALTLGNLIMSAAPPSKTGTKNKTGHKNSERWSSAPLNLSWLKSLDADLSIKAASILYGSWDLKEPSLIFSLDNGKLSIKDLKSNLFGGSIEGSATLHSTGNTTNPLTSQGRMTLQNVKVSELVKAMARSNFVKASGRINLEASLKTQGQSVLALVQNLSGDGLLTGSDVILNGIDLDRFANNLSGEASTGDTILGLWKGASKGGQTKFTKLDGVFDIKDGNINVQNLDLESASALLNTTGNIDLPDWRLKTAHKITLRDRADVPPFTIKIEGPLDNPAQTFAQGALNDYLTRKINAKLEKLLIDKLGLPSPKAAPTATSPASPAPPSTTGQAEPQKQPNPTPQDFTPEEAFRGLLEGLIH